MPTKPKSKAAAKKSTAPKSGGSPGPAEELTPTSPEEWGSSSVPVEEGFVVELPSGNRALVRRTMDLPILLKSGQIPNPLAQIIQKMMDTGDPTLPTDKIKGTVSQQLLMLIDDTTMRCMLSPKVSRPIPQGKDETNGPKETWEQYTKRIAKWKPAKGTISIFQIEMQDKLFLFSVAQGMATDLSTFRAEANSALALVQASSDVAHTPQRTSRTGAPRVKAKPKKRR